MSGARYDAIVIGGGHNGLVTAGYLARAGRKTLVLERGAAAGGCVATEELWPGHRVDIGAHSTGGLDSRVVADLGLDQAGLELIDADPMLAALQPGDAPLLLWRDPARSAASIRRFSERDAARWPDFVAAMDRAARTLRVLYASPPPKVSGAGPAELFELARLGMRLGRVGRSDAIELMRLLPMTIQELLEEWFESDALLGALAALGCRGIRQGPMAAGTAFVFIHGLVGGGPPRASRLVRGGMGRLSELLVAAVEKAGADLRTAASVACIDVDGDRVRGVTLESGEAIESGVVASSTDPVRTLLELVDPAHLDPEVVRQAGNIRIDGVCAKVHLALDGLPGVAGADDGVAAMCVAPGIEYLERAFDDAKYGRVSSAPMLEAFVPTVLDQTLAPAGRHIMSVLVQYAPHSPKEGAWDDARRNALADATVRTLDAHLPGLADRVHHRHVLAPTDLETRFGLTGGHGYHGEMTLDQVFIGRPMPGWARYELPLSGLYLCGAGAHPGGGVTGSPGANAARAIIAGT